MLSEVCGDLLVLIVVCGVMVVVLVVVVVVVVVVVNFWQELRLSIIWMGKARQIFWFISNTSMSTSDSWLEW